MLSWFIGYISSLSTSKYFRSCCLMLKRNCPWNGRFNKTPKHTSNRAASWFQTNKINVMERPAQSSDLYPVESLWGDIKHAVSEAKPRNERNYLFKKGTVGCSPMVLLEYLLTGGRRWSTPCNTDVRQFSETVVIQINISCTKYWSRKQNVLWSGETMSCPLDLL